MQKEGSALFYTCYNGSTVGTKTNVSGTAYRDSDETTRLDKETQIENFSASFYFLMLQIQNVQYQRQNGNKAESE